MERKLIVAILLLAIAALATQALVWVFTPRDNGNNFVGPPRSDYTLADFTLNALDHTGALAFSVRGPWLARKQDNGSIYITTPNYEIIDNSRNVWKGTSDAAQVNKDGTIMQLEGKVDMHRLATAKVDPVRILTRNLTVTTPAKKQGSNTQKSQAKRLDTAALTTITDPNHVAHGVGMKADLGLKTVELLADVHWIALPTHHATTQK